MVRYVSKINLKVKIKFITLKKTLKNILSGQVLDNSSQYPVGINTNCMNTMQGIDQILKTLQSGTEIYNKDNIQAKCLQKDAGLGENDNLVFTVDEITEDIFNGIKGLLKTQDNKFTLLSNLHVSIHVPTHGTSVVIKAKILF